MSLRTNINLKIRKLNKLGKPVIFVVTGNNSTGKTTITRRLIQDFSFYQSINLGVVSKMIRFFRPDIKPDELENFDSNTAAKTFKGLVQIIIEAYTNSGVNLIIDGVQVDTANLLRNTNVLGGVVLKISPQLSIRRGDRPETHFKRQLTKYDLKRIHYKSNRKFKIINNDRKIGDTYGSVVIHLNSLLNDNLKKYEQK